MKLGLGLLVLACAAMNPRPAHACSFPGPGAHTLDPAAMASDRTPPTLAPAAKVTVTRGKGPVSHGCGGTVSASSCDDIGQLHIALASSDDVAQSAQIGYRLRLLTGTLPSGLALPAEAVRFSIGPALLLTWIDGASDDQEPFAFALEITPVDTAGNAGAPITVAISDGGSGQGGCAYASRARIPLAAWILILPLFALARRRLSA